MLGRQRTGSVVCPSCGNLVGVNDERCFTCGRWNPGLWGFTPMLRRFGADFGFAQSVTGACVVLYVLMLLHSGPHIQTRGLFQFLSPSLPSMFLFGASGALPVFRYDRWWTVLSAGWLHGGLLHILFNMLWIRQLGPATVELFGTGRTIMIYTLGGAVGFVFSSFMGWYLPGMPLLGGAQFTIGASAPIFALLGALVHYGRNASSAVKSQALGYAMMLFVFGLMMPGVDNWAHGGGFIGGYGMATLLNPMRPETGNHLLIGAGCLVLTLLSIVGSVAFGFQYL
jgi:rhomboid protease GluP